MSVHYFFNYREHLVKKLKDHYASLILIKKEEELLEQQLSGAEDLIRDYFEVIADELQEVLSAAENEVKLEFDGDDFLLKFTLVNNFVRFIRRPKSIEVEIGRFDPTLGWVENFILAYIVPGEKKCHVRKVGTVHESGTFDDNSINFFMREAFGEIVKAESEAKA